MSNLKKALSVGRLIVSHLLEEGGTSIVSGSLVMLLQARKITYHLMQGKKTMQPMFNSCCADLLVNVSTEYPELVGYQGIYHPTINETTGIGGEVKFFLHALVHICVSNFWIRLSVREKE